MQSVLETQEMVDSAEPCCRYKGLGPVDGWLAHMSANVASVRHVGYSTLLPPKIALPTSTEVWVFDAIIDSTLKL